MSTNPTNSQRDGQTTTTPVSSNGLGRHLDWSTIPVEQTAEGIERQMLVGKNMMDQEVVLIDIFSPPREDFLE